MVFDTSKYIGIPFVDYGRDEDGCDCWGLAKMVFMDIHGTELPDYQISAYEVDDIIDTMSIDKDKFYKEINYKNSEMEIGDLVALSIHPKYPDMINHVGIFIGRDLFIHTQSSTGCIISSICNIIWSQRIKGVYRWVG